MASTRSFAAGIDAFIKKTGLSASVVIRKLAFDAYVGVVIRSPVKEGRFRADWRIGIGQSPGTPGRPLKSVKYRDPPTPSEVGRATRALANVKWTDTIHLTNTMPYAKKLEEGKKGKGGSKQNDYQKDGILGAAYEELKANLFKEIQKARSMN